MVRKTVSEYLDDQAKEWGQYVATEAIDINGARAFNVGDAVPVSHVEGGIVDSEQVSRTGTKAAAAATGEES